MPRTIAALLTISALTLAFAGCTTKEEKGSGATRPAPTPGAPNAEPGAAAAPAADAAATAARGHELYDRACASCHGPDGHGDGPMAGVLKVKPRSFGEEAWRHIGRGIEETDHAGIVRVVTFGIPEASMNGFAAMFSVEEIGAIADHVLELRGTK